MQSPLIFHSKLNAANSNKTHKMSKKSAIPDAWDDDWESQADKADAAAATARVEEQIKISKAERLAQHAETNKKIWESAYVLNSSSRLPIIIVLSEKPQNQTTFSQHATMSRLSRNSNQPSNCSVASRLFNAWIQTPGLLR